MISHCHTLFNANSANTPIGTREQILRIKQEKIRGIRLFVSFALELVEVRENR